MNLILLTNDDNIAEGTRVRLAGRRLRHVREVHRASLGDELAVGLLNGKIGTGRVMRFDEQTLEMDIRLDREPPAPPPLTLVLALPRPKVMRRALFSLTVMGVKHVILLNTARVEKSYWQTPFLEGAAIRRQLLLGLEQAKDTVLPEVVLRKRFKPFVEDELPGLIQGATPLLAHPGAGVSCPFGVQGRVVLAVGPEGGFVPYEVEKLSSLGFTPVSLGGRIMNVESALPALIGRIF